MPGDGDDGLTLAYRDLIGRTDLLNPFYSTVHKKPMYTGAPIIHPISSILPAIRLGLRDKFDSIRKLILSHRLAYGQSCSYMMNDGGMPKEVYGYEGFLWYDWRSVENKYAGVIATSEMMLQSQGEALRLFPLWPEGQSAAFRRFRARGGFVVSAKLSSKGEISAEIESAAGLPCRIRTSGKVRARAGDMEIPAERNGKDVVFNTQKGSIYQLEITNADD